LIKFILGPLQFLVMGLILGQIVSRPLWSLPNLVLLSYTYVAVATLWYVVNKLMQISATKSWNVKIAERRDAILRETPVPTRMEVNAAIDRLIETSMSDPMDARQIVMFACQHASSSANWVSGALNRQNNAPFTGVTDELGDIKIEDGTKTSSQFEYGKTSERVGHYKIHWHGNIITIRHFWKADITTSATPGEMANNYVLFFDPKTLTARAFGSISRAERLAIKIGKSTLIVSDLIVLLLDSQHIGQYHRHGRQFYFVPNNPDD